MGHEFGEALKKLRAGQRVTRAEWNSKHQYLELQVPDAGSNMTLPYIYITTGQSDRVPWLPSHTDLLAEDWETVNDGGSMPSWALNQIVKYGRQADTGGGR
jgi:hypothetical protein